MKLIAKSYDSAKAMAATELHVRDYQTHNDSFQNRALPIGECECGETQQLWFYSSITGVSVPVCVCETCGK